MAQRYRADSSRVMDNGAIAWYSEWMGGPSLARVNKCPVIVNDVEVCRAAVYTSGEPDTWFSTPANTRIHGKYTKGYLTNNNDNTGLEFRAYKQQAD